MNMAAMIPQLADKELATLHANALRLQAQGGTKQDAAAELLPLIAAELAERSAKAPKKAVRKKKAVVAAEEA